MAKPFKNDAEELEIVKGLNRSLLIMDNQHRTELDRLRAELAEANARTGKCGMEGHNEPCYYCGEPCNSLVGNPSRWPVALCHADEPGVVKWHHTGCVMERLAELAEWKERHPYGEVDLDMAIEAETKDLKLRIDTLEGAQIDYEAQCAAKDASIKEEFDKYCRNLTELAQVHKESCDAKDARIAELEAYHTNCTDYINGLLGNMADDDKERVAILARAERAEAKCKALREALTNLTEAMSHYGTVMHAYVWKAHIEARAVLAGEQPVCNEKADLAVRLERAEAERDREMYERHDALHELGTMRNRAERAEARIAALIVSNQELCADNIAKDARIAEAMDRLCYTADECNLVTACEHWVANFHEADARAERVEAERDALLYNAESKYCAGLGAGFELGRNDDRAELSRIITQRWMEIADAKARAALDSSKEG